MARRFGGETPQGGELRLSVQPPTGTTEAAPVLEGEVFKLGLTASDGTGYRVVPLVALDTPNNCVMVQANHRQADPNGNLGVTVLGQYSQVRRAKYDGAPAIGQSVGVGANLKKLTGVAGADGGGYIVFIDTVTTEIEFIA